MKGTKNIMTHLIPWAIKDIGSPLKHRQMAAIPNAAKAKGRVLSSAIPKIKIPRESIFILGSHLWIGDSLWANRSISSGIIKTSWRIVITMKLS
jgi:hypothetical protein